MARIGRLGWWVKFVEANTQQKPTENHGRRDEANAVQPPDERLRAQDHAAYVEQPESQTQRHKIRGLRALRVTCRAIATPIDSASRARRRDNSGSV
jgi:hypothetical protein